MNSKAIPSYLFRMTLIIMMPSYMYNILIFLPQQAPLKAIIGLLLLPASEPDFSSQRNSSDSPRLGEVGEESDDVL